MHHYANTATCAMLYYTLLDAAPDATNAHIFIYFFLSAREGSAYRPQPLAAGCSKGEVAGEWEGGGSAAAETEKRVWPSPGRPCLARPSAATTSAVSLEPNRILSSEANSRGNVSLGVEQETSMPKQGASCPDTALPVDYVRTFLPFTLSLYMCLSPTPLAVCLWANLLRAVVCFSSPCVRSGGVEVCARACVDAFTII